MVGQTVATFGRLVAAFNNAACRLHERHGRRSLAEEFDRVNAINLRGVWACMKHELRHMRVQGSGAIVNCSSLGGLVGTAEPGGLPCVQAWRDRIDQERRGLNMPRGVSASTRYDRGSSIRPRFRECW